MKKYLHKILLPNKKKYIYPLLDNGLSKGDLYQGIKVLRSGRITMGKKTIEFERQFAKTLQIKYALMVNSGSSALYIGVEAFNFKKGSEVITPALTFGTSVGCIIKNGLVPVFVDVEPNTFNIDVTKIEEMISDKTVAILAPNLMGNICKWDKIREIADKYSLTVIEDSADTLGAKYKGRSIFCPITVVDISILSTPDNTLGTKSHCS